MRWGKPVLYLEELVFCRWVILSFISVWMVEIIILKRVIVKNWLEFALWLIRERLYLFLRAWTRGIWVFFFWISNRDVLFFEKTLYIIIILQVFRLWILFEILIDRVGKIHLLRRRDQVLSIWNWKCFWLFYLNLWRLSKVHIWDLVNSNI